jgi:hypothetical protein
MMNRFLLLLPTHDTGRAQPAVVMALACMPGADARNRLVAIASIASGGAFKAEKGLSADIDGACTNTIPRTR